MLTTFFFFSFLQFFLISHEFRNRGGEYLLKIRERMDTSDEERIAMDPSDEADVEQFVLGIRSRIPP